jgi:hypothetical protein
MGGDYFMRYFVFVLATLLALPAAAQEAAPAIHRPVLSPLGNEVAYMVMVEQDWELFVSNIDGQISGL